MAQRETQSQAGRGAKRKTGPSGAPPPKKAQTPSAALGRAPPEGDTETSLTPVAPVVEQAVATRVLEADSLEEYLIGQEVPMPKAVPEPTLPTGQEDIALPSMGGFLAELRGRVPKGGKRGTVVPTPIPRRSAEKWKPVLGKPTIPTATAASVLMPQQKTTGGEMQSSSDPVPVETVVEMPAPLVEIPTAETASTGLEVQLPGADEPSLPDSTRVTTEGTDSVVAGVTGSTSVEVMAAVVHQEDLAALSPIQSEEGPGAETQPEAMETGPNEEPVAAVSGQSTQQELSDILPERGVLGEETVQTPVETAAEAIQTGGDPDPNEGQEEEAEGDHESSNIPSVPETLPSQQGESSEGEGGDSSDGQEEQDSERVAREESSEDEEPQEESGQGASEGESSPSDGEDETARQEDEPPGSDNDKPGQDEPPTMRERGEDDTPGGSELEQEEDRQTAGGEPGENQPLEVEEPAEEENQQVEAEDQRRQEEGDAPGQLDQAAGRPAQGVPQLQIRLVTRQAQARMRGLQYTGPCLLANQVYPSGKSSADIPENIKN